MSEKSSVFSSGFVGWIHTNTNMLITIVNLIIQPKIYKFYLALRLKSEHYSGNYIIKADGQWTMIFKYYIYTDDYNIY